MKKLLPILLFAFVVEAGFSQPQTMVWYFGNKAGIDFSTGSPVSLDSGKMIAEAGCSVISNSTGQLQFYTNGMKVWNRNHKIMANGDSLFGSQYLNQNSIIVPKPLSGDSVYYLFTVNQRDSIARFTASIINMNLENGLGRVVVKNRVIASDPVEKIAAVKHCNGSDYWIIVHDMDNVFTSILLTGDSISEMVNSKTGISVKADIGYLKISPAGDKLVLPVNNGNVLAQLFDFDDKTGKVSNPVSIYQKINNTYAFGFEFSPDGNMLYMTTGGKRFELWQFDLRNPSENDFNNRAILISTGNNFAMQLAPDNKIYIARENSSFLNVIQRPDGQGEKCDYQKKGFKLTSGNSFKGLPVFVQSWFYRPAFDVLDACYGDSTVFVFNRTGNMESAIWKFSPGEGNPVIGGNRFRVSRLFKDTIAYVVTLRVYHCEMVENIEKEVEVVSYPQSVLINDTILCRECSVVLDPGEADTYLWNTGSTGRYLNVSEPGLYSVQMKNNECMVEDSALIGRYHDVVGVPSAFTPNNDGLNDRFEVITTGKLYNYKMQIYNRYGMLVFVSENPEEGWDGTYNEKPCPKASYFWYLNYDSFQENGLLSHKLKKGFVTIIR